MSMQNKILFVCALLPACLVGCLRASKPAATDVQCPQLITQAQSLYASKAKSLDSVIAEQAANLITAAKIDQEHQEFITCMDKASRAIKIIDPDAEISVQYNN
jgi:hypothetical protein